MSITYQLHQLGNSLRKQGFKSLFLFALTFSCVFVFSSNQVLASSLEGRILLQVEEKGEAWYVNPEDGKRFYLGRPDNAFDLMRSFGLGASDKDIGYYQKTKAPQRLSGKILLQVQDKGQAFYVNPLNLKLYYLGRPADAFYLMRSLALGISNNDLNKIKVSNLSKTAPDSENKAIKRVTVDSQDKIDNDFIQTFKFKYKNDYFSLEIPLSSALYSKYSNSQKTISFPTSVTPELRRDTFYAYFLQQKAGDNSIKYLITEANKIAQQKKWSKQEVLDFLLALVQQIPYDHAKVLDGTNIDPFFPYETLYLNKGVCSDKSFLAALIAREMGYGAAILDFPELNHSALGISCDKSLSVKDSGYCYLETTNYFPIGVIPQLSSEGEAINKVNDFKNLLNSSSLGTMEVYQKTIGFKHSGVLETKQKISEIISLNEELDLSLLEVNRMDENLSLKKDEIENLRARITNQETGNTALIYQFNELIAVYNRELQDYSQLISKHNDKANNFNVLVANFYQK